MCGCNKNGLTNCGCEDNCPDKTSELTFDGVLNNISVPQNSSLNDVLLLLEEHSTNLFNSVNLSYELGASNCLGLEPGTYSFNQIFDAIIAKLCSPCSLTTEIEANSSFSYTVNVSGGTPSYTYEWKNKSTIDMFTISGESTDTVTLTPLFPDEKIQLALLEVKVTDSNGCVSEDQFLVLVTNIIEM